MPEEFYDQNLVLLKVVANSFAAGAILGDDGDLPEVRDFYFESQRAYQELQNGDFRVGDRVVIFTGPDRNIAVGISHYDMHPRKLHERLARIEAALGVLD